MGVINLTEEERTALAAINERELDNLIDRACDDARLGDLYHLPLSRCGLYVGSKLYYFEQRSMLIVKRNRPRIGRVSATVPFAPAARCRSPSHNETANGNR